MQVLNSRTFTIKKDIETVFGIASEPESAKHFLSRVSDKPAFSGVTIGPDSIVVPLPYIGKLLLKRNRLEAPSLVSYRAEGSPVPIELVLNLQPTTAGGAETTTVQISLEVDAPDFALGMIKAKVNPMLEKMANGLEQLDVDRFLGRQSGEA